MIKLISYGRYYGPFVSKVDRIVITDEMFNPWTVAKLRRLTGREAEVQQFMLSNCPKFKSTVVEMVDSIQDGMTVAFKCFGGRHRSVALAEVIGERLQLAGFNVEIYHRDIDKEKV